MTKNLPLFFQQKVSKRLFFLLSIFVLLYWITAACLPVYVNKFTGIFFEMLWFPVLLLTFIIPLIALMAWISDRFNWRSLYLYILLMGVVSVLFLLLR